MKLLRYKLRWPEANGERCMPHYSPPNIDVDPGASERIKEIEAMGYVFDREVYVEHEKAESERARQESRLKPLLEYEKRYGTRCDMDELARVFELDLSDAENRARADSCFNKLACSFYGTAIREFIEESPERVQKLRELIPRVS